MKASEKEFLRRQVIIDDFFDKFLVATETRYWVWKKYPNVMAGHLAEDILDYILKYYERKPKY